MTRYLQVILPEPPVMTSAHALDTSSSQPQRTNNLKSKPNIRSTRTKSSSIYVIRTAVRCRFRSSMPKCSNVVHLRGWLADGAEQSSQYQSIELLPSKKYTKNGLRYHANTKPHLKVPALDILKYAVPNTSEAMSWP
jgi:hypothetical protein